MAYKVLIISFLALFVDPSKALGAKKYQIADSELKVTDGDLVTIAPGTKFVLTEDFQLKLEGEIKFQKMDKLTVKYYLAKESVNWFKTGDIEVCEAMEDHKDSEKGNKMATCMMNLFGLGTSCPIEQHETDGSHSCDISEAKDKFEMAIGKTTFQYDLRLDPDEPGTIIEGFIDIQKK